MSWPTIHGRILPRVTWGILALVAVCYTSQDVMNARCDVACAREGYTNGVYDGRTARCLCQDSYEVERLTKKKMKLPARGPIHTAPGNTDPAPTQSQRVLFPDNPWNE